MRGQPILFIGGGLSLLGAGALLGLGHGTSQFALSIPLFLLGSLAIALASAKPTGENQGNKLALGLSTFLILATVASLFGAAEFGAFSDEHGHQDPGAHEGIRFETLGSEDDQFTLQGPVQQVGTSRIIVFPERATNWTLDMVWNQFATDTQSQEVLVEERVQGEWMIVAQQDATAAFEQAFLVEGDAMRVTLTAQQGPGARNVNLNVAFVFDASVA